MMETNNSNSLLRKVLSAVFFGISSIILTIVNKFVLTSYRFPSFLVLGLGQIMVSIVILFIGKTFKIISYPGFSRDTLCKMCPLPLLYLGNMMFGLGGMQALSLPMFTAIRRFSILITMLLELCLIGIKPSILVQISVFFMISGAIIAAINDLSFNLEGYLYVMITNILSAAYGVCIKKKLLTSEMGKYGLMYYNSIFMFLPALILTWVVGDLHKSLSYERWSEPIFALLFFISCIMGFVLTYSIILCTDYNSALTTVIVGSLKSICITYIGMFIGGDYIFSWSNFLGINISVIGSAIYIYELFRKKPRALQPNVGESNLTTRNGQPIAEPLPNIGAPPLSP